MFEGSMMLHARPGPGFPALLLALLLLAGCGAQTAEEHLAEAVEYLEEGDESAAEIELKNALRKDPQLGQAHALLGQMRFAEGDLPNALQNLNKALDLGAGDDELSLDLLNVKIGLGEYSEVIGELEEQSGLTPEKQIILAEAYLLAEDVEQAKALYQNNLQLADGLLGMSKVAFLENDTPRALNYARQAIEVDPDHTSAWLFRGEMELVAGDSEAALASFKQAQEYPQSEIGGRIGEVRALLVANELDKARALIDKLVSRGGPQAAYLQAVISFRQGDLNAAEDALNVVNQYAENNLQALYLTGVVYYRQGKLPTAERALRRYLERDSGNVPVRKLLAAIANDQNRPQKVVELLQPVAAQYSDPQVWAMLGSALLRLGETETATDAFQSAVALAPDMAAFRNQLALGLYSGGDGDSAIRELNSAIELSGDQLPSEYLLVMVKTREGDFEGAQAALDSLATAHPENPIVPNLQGSLHLAQNNLDMAAASFEQALALDGAYVPAVQNLSAIAELNGDVARARQLYLDFSAGDHLPASLALVDLAVRQGDFDEALDSIAAIVKKFPESSEAHMGSARLLMATGNFTAAEDAVLTARELVGELPDVLMLKAEIDLRQGDRTGAMRAVSDLQEISAQYAGNSQVLQALGTLQMRLDDMTAARRNLQLAVDNSDELLPAAVLSLVRLELLEDNPAAAQKLLRQLTNAGLQSEEISLLQGDALVAAQQIDAARQQYASLVSAGSRAGTSKLAMLDLRENRFEDAKDLLEQWLSENPDDKGMQKLLATAQVQLGESEAARRQYESLLPTQDPVVLNNLAWIYMTESDPRALEFARRANQAAPNNPDIQDTLGWILVNDGEVREGLGLLRDSARQRPDNASVQYHLGVAYHKLGDRENAIEALEKALTIGDFNEAREARRILEELSSS
ncbi:MAG: XrtA/PEP-CTERM system TPR-repeat protein PrsT [Pseudomonadota bacterium]